MEKLCDLLLELDSDEGIRIDNPISGKKIYINRNLLGIYNILIRTKKEKKDNKGRAENNNRNITQGVYLEEIQSYDNASQVLKFLIQNIDKPRIWLY
jgi:hypothetical protein